MKFTINSLVLWPKKEGFSYRKLPFQDGKINIITGASRTGKSAIIPIIDYCLCSDKCSIPVDIIRNSCAWFGILINLESEQLLICRREPGTKAATNEMYICRDVSVNIPNKIEPNTNSESVKNTLNELFGMSFLDLDPDSNNFSARPSFRDFMAFLFQPQNIIANADVLFYKADTTEHRQKLINIFPYVLGSVTPEVLSARQELDRLKKIHERLQRDMDAIKNVSESWRQEVSGWLSYARELGLTTYIPSDDSSFDDQVFQLERIVEKTTSDSVVNATGIKDFSDELIALRKEEQVLSSHLFALQKRQSNMTLLNSSMTQYEQALQIQLERLEISSWLKKVIDPEKMPPLSQTDNISPSELLNNLCHAIEIIEQSAGNMKTVPAAFEREMQLVDSEIRQTSEKLEAVRRRIREEDSMYVKAVDEKYTLSAVSRFLGRLEASIQTYRRIGKDAELETQLSQIDSRIELLSKKVNENEIKRKQDAALRYISQKIGNIIPYLDTEHPDDPVDIVIKDLSVKIKNKNGAENYLWEIGSASNWLAYHVAVILSFQFFFQNRGTVRVPNFVVFDQPSQVYFPQQLLSNSEEEEKKDNLSDEDKLAVRKVFEAMAKFLQSVDSKVQIIVAEHADDDIWGDISEVHLVERWRGNTLKLIPEEWLSE